MTWFPRIRTSHDADIAEEIRSHIEEKADEIVDRGVPREEAIEQARRAFGNLTVIEEQAREIWTSRWLEHFVSDVRFAVRQLRKAPAFAAAGILTLALGIGANTTMFSVLYGVLLRPLPFTDASRLIVLNETTPKVGTVSVSYPNFRDWRSQSRQFSALAFVHNVGFTLGGTARPEAIIGDAVSPNFLSMLGVHPVLGRDFNAAEESPATSRVAMLSYVMWQSHFGGNPDVLHRTITLDGRTFAIVGVLPADYRFLDNPELLLPSGVWQADNTDEASQRGARGDGIVVGRLAPGASLAGARAELQGIAARWRRRTRPTTVSSAYSWRCCATCSWAMSGQCSWCSAARSFSCSSSRAPTWLTCCCRATSHARARSPSVPFSGPAASESRRRCLPGAWCSRRLAACSD